MTVTQLISALHSGQITQDQLTTERRQACVAHLTLEGFSSSEVAHLLSVSERTIHRDRAAVRRAYAVKPADDLGDELLGELERLVHAAVQRAQRIARDPNAKPELRLSASQGAVRTYRQFVETTYRLKYIKDGRERLNHDQLRDTLGDNWFEDFVRATRDPK
jgi:hypothetical protein